jgi:hypothetical protein
VPEQWATQAKLVGREQYVTEITQAFEKSGYKGYLLYDAKDSETEGDYDLAAADYAMLGDKNAAFAALEKAFSNRAGLLFVKVEPQFDNLRSDPRYAGLLGRIGLPQ